MHNPLSVALQKNRENCVDCGGLLQILQRVEKVVWTSRRWHNEAGHDWHQEQAERAWAFQPQLCMHKLLTPTAKVKRLSQLLEA